MESRRRSRGEPYSLASVGRQVVEHYELAARNRHLEVCANFQEVELTGERELAHFALANLLSNAIDFSPDGGVIIMSLYAEGGEAVMRVMDEGPGIPEYAAEKIYQRFFSLPRPESGEKSSGLGLSIVKEFVTLQGGSITLENGDYKGAVATLRLPLKNALPG